jgi:hypothetical protein
MADQLAATPAAAVILISWWFVTLIPFIEEHFMIIAQSGRPLLIVSQIGLWVLVILLLITVWRWRGRSPDASPNPGYGCSDDGGWAWDRAASTGIPGGRVWQTGISIPSQSKPCRVCFTQLPSVRERYGSHSVDLTEQKTELLYRLGSFESQLNRKTKVCKKACHPRRTLSALEGTR